MRRGCEASGVNGRHGPEIFVTSLRTLARGLGFFAGAAVLWGASGCDRGSAAPHDVPVARTAEAKSEKTYLERLSGFHTKLARSGPAPQPYEQEAPPAGVDEVTYRSGSLALRAWIAFPTSARAGGKSPAVVYFHGGFAFGREDFEDARPFLDAGFVVMCPTLRGENGNPGVFEMYLGEVEDAKAAILWLSGNPRVDSERIYAFGHSAGGVISALLSLHDVPLRHSGSSGALYSTAIFDLMKDSVPFSRDDPAEGQLRVLLGNTKWMKRAHYAYTGAEDRFQELDAALRESGAQPLIRLTTTSGDHQTSLQPSVREYLKVIRDNP